MLFNQLLILDNLPQIFGIATDLSVLTGVLIALKIIWGAFRKDKAESDKREKALVEQALKLQELIQKTQDKRVAEALEREDKNHLILSQYSTRLQELATTVSQMQYIVLLALRVDGTKLDPPIQPPVPDTNYEDRTDD